MRTSADPFGHRPRRYWRVVSVEVPVDLTEVVADLVAECSGAGVAIDEVPVVGGLARERVVGYLPESGETDVQEARLREGLADLARRAPGSGPIAVQRASLREEDWGASWKEHFRPFPVIPRLVIRPSWEGYLAREGEHVIEMDPGMAFGTGLHASTRQALVLLEERLARTPLPGRVLDLGTGTGILGMACACWGVSDVLAADNDPDAVAAARENVVKNRLAGRMRVAGDDLSRIEGPFDLIVANITANVLVEIAPMLVARLATGGDLVLAGILAGEQVESVRTAYAALGLGAGALRLDGEWAALAFSRRA